MKKRNILLLCLVFVLVLAGCSKAASIQTMKTTVGNYKLGFKGEHKREVELKEDGSGFYVKNSNGDRVIDATYVYGDMIEGEFEITHNTINDTVYIVIEDETGLNYLTYLGQYGADIGVCFTVDNEEEMNYVYLSGKNIEGAVTNVDNYFTKIVEVNDSASGLSTEEKPESEANLASDSNTYTFPNGKSFVSSIEHDEMSAVENENQYLVGDTIMVSFISSSLDVDACSTTLAENIKENSGRTPAVTINKEGHYITGVYDDMLVLMFITEGKDGGTYVINYQTIDADTATDNMYSFVDDLLASGITKVTSRVKYEEGETGEGLINVEPDKKDSASGSTTDKLPNGYKITYDCEYFTSYSNDKYEITIYGEVEEDIAKLKNGGKSIILSEEDYNILTNEFTVNNQKVWVCEAETKDMDIYTYYAIAENGLYLRFSEMGGYELSNEKIVSLLSLWL